MAIIIQPDQYPRIAAQWWARELATTATRPVTFEEQLTKAISEALVLFPDGVLLCSRPADYPVPHEPGRLNLLAVLAYDLKLELSHFTSALMWVYTDMGPEVKITPRGKFRDLVPGSDPTPPVVLPPVEPEPPVVDTGDMI